MPDTLGIGAAQHLWMAGGIGLMTLAVMTRATLDHTGRALTAGPGTTGLYVALVLAVLARLAAGTWSAKAEWLHGLSGLAWLAALYGPLLARPRPKT